jgi:hypothetical protein
MTKKIAKAWYLASASQDRARIVFDCRMGDDAAVALQARYSESNNGADRFCAKT